jgi:poly(A) polymerase
MSIVRKGNLLTTLTTIFHLLTDKKKQGYIVGGFVRDWLLKRETNDIDIAVDGNAVSIAREVARKTGGTFVLLDDIHNTARVVVTEGEPPQGTSPSAEPLGREWCFDFSSFFGEIKSDLGRRDFTVDAMALELGSVVEAGESASAGNRKTAGTSVAAGKSAAASSRKAAGALAAAGHREVVNAPAQKRVSVRLIDPFSGRDDLRDRLIRRVSPQIFEADPARLLRAVRLAAELDFTIEADTESLIVRHSPSVAGIPGERVRDELLRLLAGPRGAYHLRYLDKLGLLLALIPELADGKGVEQPTMHFWDVFEHSLRTVAAIEFLLRESDWEYSNDAMLPAAPWSDAIERHLSEEVSGGSNHKVLLKLAGLLHDIAKPVTKSIDDTGRARFLGHTKQGAEMAANVMERLRFSNRETRLVENLVYNHLRPAQMTDGELPSRRAIYRYFRDTGEGGIDILLLALADYLASRGPLVSMEEWQRHCRLMNYILEEHDKQQEEILPVKLIDGNDIMGTFGLSPGSLIGRLLAAVNEAHASGELSTREEALALVQRELSAVGKKPAAPRKSRDSALRIPTAKAD